MCTGGGSEEGKRKRLENQKHGGFEEGRRTGKQKTKWEGWRSFAFNNGNCVENSQRLYFKELWTLKVSHIEEILIWGHTSIMFREIIFNENVNDLHTFIAYTH